MNDDKEIKEFQAFIVLEAKSQGKDPKKYAQELGEDGLKKAYQRFLAQKQKKAQKALHGAKLNYFKSLKHQCAEGEELVYYKKGGSVNCGCKKKEDGGEVKPKKDCGGGPVAKFKKMREGDKVVNGSTKQPMLDAKKKEEEARKKELHRIYGSDVVKKSQEDYDKGVADHRMPSREVKRKIPQAKIDHMSCGSKVKKHQTGSVIALFKASRKLKK